MMILPYSAPVALPGPCRCDASTADDHLAFSPGWHTWLPQTLLGSKLAVVRLKSPVALVKALASCVIVMDKTIENRAAKTRIFLDIFSICKV